MNDRIDHDVEAIAGVILRIRGRREIAGGDWDYPGIKAGVAAAVRHGRDYTRPIEAVAIACIRCAADRRNRTPQVMGMPGPHWHDPGVDTSRQPPRRGQECPAHPGQWRDRCAGCAGDAHAIDVGLGVIELEANGLAGRDLYRAVRRQLRRRDGEAPS